MIPVISVQPILYQLPYGTKKKSGGVFHEFCHATQCHFWENDIGCHFEVSCDRIEPELTGLFPDLHFSNVRFKYRGSSFGVLKGMV